MNMVRGFWLVLLMCVASPALAAAKLELSNAWIPQAPPGATMYAGYIHIHNSGDKEARVLAVQSSAFRNASVHETVVEDGVARMRELTRLEIAAGADVKMAPGGMHLMLMDPRRPIVPGERIEIVFLLADGQRVTALFDVQSAGSGAD